MILRDNHSCQDGSGYVSFSELKFVMTKLDVHFTEEVNLVPHLMINMSFIGAAGDDYRG